MCVEGYSGQKLMELVSEYVAAKKIRICLETKQIELTSPFSASGVLDINERFSSCKGCPLQKL